jgi:cytochrome c5
MKKYIIMLSMALSTSAAADCDPLFGEGVYPALCATCHTHIPTAPKFEAGERLEKTDPELIETILNGKEMMPPWGNMGWTDEELASLVCYIRSLEVKE